MTERYLVIDETDAHYKDFKTRVTILLQLPETVLTYQTTHSKPSLIDSEKTQLQMLLPFVSCAIFAGWCTSFNFAEMEYQSMIVSERKRLVQQSFSIVKSKLLISVLICCHCDVKLPGIAGINPLAVVYNVPSKLSLSSVTDCPQSIDRKTYQYICVYFMFIYF